MHMWYDICAFMIEEGKCETTQARTKLHSKEDPQGITLFFKIFLAVLECLAVQVLN